MADNQPTFTPSPYPTINYNHPLGIKLTNSNFLIWQQQILAIVEGHGLEGFLTGEEETPQRLITDPESGSEIINPKFSAWRRQDQLLSAWIQSSLSESIMALVVGLKSAKDVWKALEKSFATQSKAKIMQYRMYLHSTKKESMPMLDYLNKIKACCDFLNAAGCKITEEDHILYILTGLGQDYNVIVTISSKTDAYSVEDTRALLLSFESRLEESAMPAAGSLEGSQPSLNLAHKSTFQQSQQHPGRSDGARGGFRGGRRGRGGRSYYSNRLSCQLCHKPGHMAEKCWYRFDQNFTTPQQSQPPRQYHQPTAPSHSNFNSNPAAHLAQARGPPTYSPPSFTPPSDFSSISLFMVPGLRGNQSCFS